MVINVALSMKMKFRYLLHLQKFLTLAMSRRTEGTRIRFTSRQMEVHSQAIFHADSVLCTVGSSVKWQCNIFHDGTWETSG